MENSNQALDNSTLIDITDKNDIISFIQVNRIKRKFPEAGEMLGCTITDKTHGSEFWKEGRTEISIGRWLRRIFKDVHKSSILDFDVEKFVNQYKSAYDSRTNTGFELVSGEDIKKWYHESSYESDRGQLGNSCMRYNKCQDFLDIYVKNPEVCNLLILKSSVNPVKIRGRALVWKLKDGSFYQDRVYTNYDSDTLLFNKWAEENGIEYKYSDSIGKSLEVQLGDFKYQKYPYMDTFLCYNPDNKVLSDDEDLWPGHGYIKIQDTHGGYEPDDVVWSNYYDEYIDKDSAVLCNTGNRYSPTDWIYISDAIYLEYKDEWWVPSDNIVYSEYHQESFHIDDVVWSDLIQDSLYPKNKDVIKIQIDYRGEQDYVIKSRTDLYIEIDGEYFSKETHIKDPYTKKYHFKDEMIDGVTFDKYLEDKIQEELGLDDDVITRDRLKDIYKKGSYDRSATLYEIENNEIFKYKVRGVYWGLSKENKPKSEDMLPLIFTNIYLGGVIPRYNLSISQIIEVISEFDKSVASKYEKWYRYDRRIILTIDKSLKSINYSQLGDDIYKIYLFLTL
jgi:hypothetical protein